MKKSASPNNRKLNFIRLIGLPAIVLIAAVFINALPNLRAQAESTSSFLGLANLFNWQATPAPLEVKKLTTESVEADETLAPNATVTTNGGSGLATTYPDLATAITALNAATITSPVIITATGAETAPAGGYVITASGTAVNTITITGGATITAPTPQTSGNLNDAIFKIIGGDYITISGFTMLENAANTTTAAATNNMTEFGVALFYATTTNGAQNDTIQNNTITLNRTYQNTFGIYSNSTASATAVTTGATATTTAGGNSGLKIYGNNISNVNQGISVVGPTAAADFNAGLDIGGTSAAQGNTITNWGTTGTFSSFPNVSGTLNCILVRNTINFNVSFNTLTSSVGGNTTTASERGIYVPSFSVAPTGTLSNTINSNNISVQSGFVTGTLNGIIVETTTGNATSSLSISSNNFNNFSHTVASASGAVNFINDTMANLNTTINSNTFTNISLTTTGSVLFIGHSLTNPPGGIDNISSNSIVTGFAKTGTGGGTITFINNSAGSSTTVTETWNNNNFSNITVPGATIIAGMVCTDGGTVNHTCNNNTISNITGGTGSITGILSNFGGGLGGQGNQVNGNTITNISSAGAITAINVGGSGTSTTVSSNTIGALASSGASLVVGITSAAPTSNTIFKNKVYDLSNSNASGTVSGIAVTAGTLHTIYNNLIGDLRTPAANAANPLNGINITGGTTVNVYFNTVYLNAASSGALFGSSAINASTTPTLTLRNNIFANASTVTGAGLAAAYRRSTTTLTTYANASNNNDFFGSTIFTDGTNTDATIAAYRARVAGRDSASFSENPPFISTTGSDTIFLHISTSTPTQLESGGAPIAGITDDFDGQTRNASAPDVGADEFSGIPNDQSAPVITYTPLANSATTNANRTLTVTITDGGGVAAARIYFRKNGGAYTSTACTLASGNAQNGTYSCVIDYTLLGGVATGDVIDYFVIAQDVSGNVGANPSAGIVATSVNNVTTPPTTPNTYTLVAAFPASVNVGTGETYTSLTNTGGLFAAINAGIFTGNLTVNITSDLTGELGTVGLNPINEEGAGNYTILIKPTGGVRSITGAAGLAVIRLNGADRVTIDGSQSGGTDRSLTITNTATTNGVIIIGSLGAGAGATNNTIKNCVLQAGSIGTTTVFTFGIYAGTAAGGTNGPDNDNLTIQNNLILRARTGMQIVGDATGLLDNLQITGNTLGDTVTPANSIGRIGINASLATNPTVSGNTVQSIFLTADTANPFGIIFSSLTGGTVSQNTVNGINANGSVSPYGILAQTSTGVDLSRNTVNNITSSSSASPLGISLNTGFVGSTVTRNNVTNIAYTGTGGYGGKGIEVATGSATSNLTVANNFVSNIKGDAFGASFINDSVFGIRVIGATGGVNLYYNSVNLGSGGFTSTQTGTVTSALFIGTGATALNIRNNIFANNLDNTADATDKNYAFYSQVANTAFTDINYNDYYVSGAAGVLGFLGTDLLTLTDIQTATGKDANSKNVDPLFTSATDLHLLPASTLIDIATPIAGITTDFDGQLRHPVTPDIGADEVTAFVPPTVQFNSATYTGAEGTTATITVTRTGDTTAPGSVNYATSDNGATGGAACGAGVDYITTSGTLNFAVGATSATFTVQLCPDSIFKGSEGITLTLSTPVNVTLGAQSTAALTITNISPGTLALSSATYSVNEPAGTVTITVNRTSGTNGAVSVPYTLTDGTATGGAACGGSVDYINTGGTVSFIDGQSSQTFTVAICNDTAFENDETFNVILGTATGGATTGGQNSAVVTIVSDDAAQPGVLQFSAANYPVGETGTVTVTVNRTGGSDGSVTVNYATIAGGTATGGANCSTAGVDYVTTNGTLTFGSGVTSQTFTVTICPDSLDETDETINLQLSTAGGGATIGAQSTATITIADDDTTGTFVFSAATYTVSESGTTANIPVNRTGGTAGTTATVNYSVTGGTATGGASCATAGVDYITPSGILTFGDGVTTQNISITICPDTLDEPDETVNLSLNSATNGGVIGAQSTAVLTITDDDATPTLSINDVTAAEGNAGTTAFTFTVTLSAASGQTVTVNYATADGTATQPSDYTAIGSTTLTFAPGETTKQVTVLVNGDTLNEANETFFVNLTTPTNATIADAQGVGTITNDDAAGTLSINDVTAAEGNAGTTAFTFTVTLSSVSAQTVTVQYATADGTATAPSDYTAIGSTTLTFAPGETTKTVTVLVNGDTQVEPNETFFVNLTTPTNATIADAQGVGTITNDDSFTPGTLTINDVRVKEGDTGTQDVTFTVTLTNPNPNPASVQYTVGGGTATNGVDYTATGGTLTFGTLRGTGTDGGPSIQTATITVTIIGDTLIEPNETFFVTLSNPVNATISDNQGTGIIVDDDRAYAGDFDNDQKTDYTVFRPSNGVWYLSQTSDGFEFIQFGIDGDIPVPGDYDADGITDLALFRPSNGTWYIQQSSNFALVQRQWGAATDKPVQGDYDGDRKTDIAVFRPENGTWYVIPSSNPNSPTGVQFGANGDQPVQGDYDGDGRTDYAVYRGGTWYVLMSATNTSFGIQFGAATDKPVVGDYDGDGKNDFAVYRDGTWFIYQSLTNTSRAVSFGAPNDIPTPGDYDGDGTTDISVFRPDASAIFYVLNSSNGSFSARQWGQTGDIPIPARYQP